MNPMTDTILQRIHSLATKPAPAGIYKTAAAVLRKLADDDAPAAKAHAVTGHLMKLEEPEQARVLAAVETLTKP